jgi:hypothetical protein
VRRGASAAKRAGNGAASSAGGKARFGSHIVPAAAVARRAHAARRYRSLTANDVRSQVPQFGVFFAVAAERGSYGRPAMWSPVPDSLFFGARSLKDAREAVVSFVTGVFENAILAFHHENRSRPFLIEGRGVIRHDL